KKGINGQAPPPGRATHRATCGPARPMSLGGCWARDLCVVAPHMAHLCVRLCPLQRIICRSLDHLAGAQATNSQNSS
ncbi:unnamed protein product, partial [Amoebophrya sp. A120]